MAAPPSSCTLRCDQIAMRHLRNAHPDSAVLPRLTRAGTPPAALGARVAWGRECIPIAPTSSPGRSAPCPNGRQYATSCQRRTS